MAEARATPAMPSCALLVLNWDGRRHYPHLLPSLREAVARHPAPVPVVVVDNSKLTEDLEFVRTNFPEFEVVLPERNAFLFSLNAVVAARTEDVVIILNNDLRVDPGFIAPLLEHFSDPAIFSVAATAWEWDGSRVQHGARLMRRHAGWVYRSDVRELVGPHPTIEASGGWSAFHRRRFVELGGFDEIYFPAYLEDMDLTYRAWMRGWTSVVEPRSVVFHRGGGSTKASGQRTRFLRTMHRNQAIFTVRNVGGWRDVAIFLVRLPWRIVVNFGLDRDVAVGLLHALPRIARAIAERGAVHRGALLSADEIERAVSGDGSRSVADAGARRTPAPIALARLPEAGS
jgi:GT2 family glycosyltransferase